tara:strand:- start:180 stop:434 length:255 start_codon:yes stop_codon:yes gene_type:complete
MRIQGLKNAPMGTHNIVRYVTYNGEKKIVSTYKMERSGNEIKLFHEEVDITETVRSIEFKKSGVLLMWIKPSRLGLLYSVEPLD